MGFDEMINSGLEHFMSWGDVSPVDVSGGYGQGVYESIKAGVGSAVDACYTSATGGVLDGAIDLISVNPDHLNYMITAFLYMGIVSSCCLHTALKNYNCVNDPVDKS